MRVADIIETTDGKGYYFRRNKILSKHIDFLISNQSFMPILAVELNGSSHRIEKRKDSDDQKKKVFEFVGLPIEFIEVGTDFSLDVKNLFTKYKIH